MTIQSATADYEAFLRASLKVVEADLALKHKQMASGPFPFLRSTFYRWCALYRDICPKLAAAPALMAVGDLHVENFGTWRDDEGRLIWGVNDVDEAQVMPYAIDLVRLATSALLAAQEAKLALTSEAIGEAILTGYREWLDRGGRPYVLEEEHGWLRDLATGALRDPVAFWAKIDKLPAAEPPASVAALLTEHLPKTAKPIRFASRIAGLGSLGRPRYALLAEYQGAKVVREAKAMLPSGWNWSLNGAKAALSCGKILAQARRCQDPWLSFSVGPDHTQGWVVRRLAPHCSRVEIADLPVKRDDLRLLRAMGREIANIHLGSPEAIEAVKADLVSRPAGWLGHAAARMADATEADWRSWRG